MLKNQTIKKIVTLFAISTSLMSTNSYGYGFFNETKTKNARQTKHSKRHNGYAGSGYAQQQSEQIILYPKFKMYHAADFTAFQQYLKETKEEYRTRRTSELVKISKGNTFSETIKTSERVRSFFGNVSETDRDITTTIGGGVDPQLVGAILQAYNQFDSNYDTNKHQSRQGVDMELSGQLSAAITTMMEDSLISDDNAPIVFSQGSRSVRELQHYMDGEDSLHKYTSYRTNSHDIADNATHFLYGHWSEFQSANGRRMVKVTVNLEKIGGAVKTFQAVGNIQGEAMNIIAEKLLNYAVGRDSYIDVINPFEGMQIKKPLRTNDTKTYREAAQFCALQSNRKYSFRLPYAYELQNMPGKYQRGGAYFVDTDHYSYAVADAQGSVVPAKLVPLHEVNDNQSRVQEARMQEPLRYFCVSGTAPKQVDLTEELYSELYTSFHALREANDGKITQSLCQDTQDKHDVATIKDIAFEVIAHDANPKLTGVLKQCLMAYLKPRGHFHKEYSVLRKL
jgi:hypothetical protein